MDKPVRQYQKQKDYQRHKLFRKMKRRRKAKAELESLQAIKMLKRKLKVPRFGEGKDPFYDYAERLAKKLSVDWKRPYEEVLTNLLNNGTRMDPDSGTPPEYDYRAFYEDNPQYAEDFLSAKPGTHFTDVGKTYWHPTFSNESKYSGKVSDENPTGAVGGLWLGNNYMLSEDQIKNNWNVQRTIDYIKYDSPNSFVLRPPKYEDGKVGYHRVETGNPVAFDDEGLIYDLVTGDRGRITLPEVVVQPTTKTYRDLSDLVNESDFIASNDAIQDPFGIRSSNEHLSLKARRGERSAALWAQEHPNLYNASLVASAAPFAVASAPAIVPTMDAVAASSIGSAITAGLTNPYVDAALLSAGYADALNSAMRGEFGYMNALEMLPLPGTLSKVYANSTKMLSDLKIPKIAPRRAGVENLSGQDSGLDYIATELFKNLPKKDLLAYFVELKKGLEGEPYFKLKLEFSKLDEDPIGRGLLIHMPYTPNRGYYSEFFEPDLFEGIPFVRNDLLENSLLGNRVTSNIPLLKFSNDWTGWEPYRDLIKKRLWEDWNDKGPLRSHLERSGINNPETILDYFASPELAWKNDLSLPGLLDAHGRVFKDNVLEHFFQKSSAARQEVASALEDYFMKNNIKFDFKDTQGIRDNFTFTPLNDIKKTLVKVLTADATDKGLIFDNSKVGNLLDAIMQDLLKNKVVKNDVKKYIYDGIEDFYDNAFANGEHGYIYVPLNTENWAETVSHELGHLEDIIEPIGKNAKGYGVVESSLNTLDPKSDSFLFKRAFDIKQPGIPSRYFGDNLRKSATEMALRATLLKDYLRLKAGQKITVRLLKELAQTYPLHMDNNMRLFFQSIKDWDAAAEWINTHGKAVVPITIGMGTAATVDAASIPGLRRKTLKPRIK